MQARKVYHLHVKSTGNDYYYNSIATLFENHNAIGITYASMMRYFRGKAKGCKYENSRCYVRKGIVMPKMSGKSRYFMGKRSTSGK